MPATFVTRERAQALQVGWLGVTVDGPPDPATGKRRQVHRTVRAPNNRAGAKLADAELAKMIVEVETGRALPSSGVTVGQLLERWVDHRRPGWEERFPGQPDATLARIHRHITPHVGDLPIEKLRPVDIDGLYRRWRGDGMAESTVKRMHSILHAALVQAMRWDLISSNPADRIEPPRPAKRRRSAPADEVLAALLAEAGPDMVCYLRLAAVTGARRGQMVALKWQDLDLDEGTVRFTTALARVKGGTAEKGTKADIDYGLALDAKTVEILRAHCQLAKERASAAGVTLPASGYVFTRATSPDGSKPWHPDGANQRFNRVRAKVAGAETVTPHQFRHWMATSMFADGYDPITVAGRGGWSSPSVPMSIYGHFRPVRDQAAAASLAQRLDGTPREPS
jgi:integrase